jgi:NAD+ diphosphatase
MKTRHSSRPGFVGGTLDRADPVRSDPARLATALTHPDARVILLDGLDPIVGEAKIALAPLPADARAEDYALLGFDEGRPLFVALPSALLDGGAYLPQVWKLIGLLGGADLAHYGAARSLVDWHSRHLFCARCGQPTKPEKAGWARRCGGCDAEHFPRVDPVVIMLAEHQGRVLLGRQPRFPAGRYSALAGFVEPGETIEEAVARELFEEAGVRAMAVHYVMSQPWPFPSSLMIGCIAPVTDDKLVIDTNELEDAVWVDLAGVRAGLAGEAGAPFVPPPPLAIATHLLHHWVAQR